MTPDIINGLFETLAGFFIAASCWKLWNDKQVHGISLVHPLFFNAWGFWNLFFYPHVECWWSFWGGIGVVAMNTLWTGMLIYYARNGRQIDVSIRDSSPAKTARAIAQEIRKRLRR